VTRQALIRTTTLLAMSRISTSWSLAKSSWAVLKTDKELAAIPIASFVVTITVMALLGGGAYFSLDRTERLGETEFSATPVTYVIGVIGYLAITFVVTFFAAVLVAGAYQRLTGGDPTLASAFGQARSRVVPIFLWSMLTGTVGLVLQAIRDRVGFLGDVIVGIVGAAWEIVTWLAVPVVVVEGTGPVDSLKRSASLFKQTWGENLVAQAGFGILNLVVILALMGVSALIAMVVPLLGIALGLLALAVFAVVMSTLTGIFRTALYLFASGQQVPDYFTAQELEAAFAPKKGR
jgi:hypothetical protein